MSALPRVCCTSPGQTDEEENHAGREEKNSTIVELFQLLAFSLTLYVELGVGGRVVEELIECESNDGKDDSKIIAPAPTS